MKLLRTSISLIVLALFISCQTNTSSNKNVSTASVAPIKEVSLKKTQDLSKLETAYFASGCFWCVEAIYESVKGVEEVISGYAGGQKKNPTYEQVGRGLTNHAEAVEVYYNPEVISYGTLLRIFFASHDPTTLNRQGPDRGPQYRSVAFYKNEEERETIISYIELLQKEKIYTKPITTEILPHTVFYKAEEYHQDFEKKHPNNPYIRNVSVPRLRAFQEKYPELLKQQSH